MPRKTWALGAAERVQTALDEALSSTHRCSVMLTGGRSAEDLYEIWGGMPRFRAVRRVDFFFGDERCVPLDAPDSNYALAMRTLFRGGIPGDCEVLPMTDGSAGYESAARKYGDALPDRIDLLLLGVGEDGHIASLFPGGAAMSERIRKVVPVASPKPPRDRLTVTPRVIESARRIFVLAPGDRKDVVLERLCVQPEGDPVELPARLARGAVWLADAPACGDTLAGV